MKNKKHDESDKDIGITKRKIREQNHDVKESNNYLKSLGCVIRLLLCQVFT